MSMYTLHKNRKAGIYFIIAVNNIGQTLPRSYLNDLCIQHTSWVKRKGDKITISERTSSMLGGTFNDYVDIIQHSATSTWILLTLHMDKNRPLGPPTNLFLFTQSLNVHLLDVQLFYCITRSARDLRVDAVRSEKL